MTTSEQASDIDAPSSARTSGGMPGQPMGIRVTGSSRPFGGRRPDDVHRQLATNTTHHRALLRRAGRQCGGSGCPRRSGHLASEFDRILGRRQAKAPERVRILSWSSMNRCCSASRNAEACAWSADSAGGKDRPYATAASMLVTTRSLSYACQLIDANDVRRRFSPDSMPNTS